MIPAHVDKEHEVGVDTNSRELLLVAKRELRDRPEELDRRRVHARLLRALGLPLGPAGITLARLPLVRQLLPFGSSLIQVLLSRPPSLRRHRGEGFSPRVPGRKGWRRRCHEPGEPRRLETGGGQCFTWWQQ